jgi:hypothetical protein
METNYVVVLIICIIIVVCISSLASASIVGYEIYNLPGTAAAAISNAVSNATNSAFGGKPDPTFCTTGLPAGNRCINNCVAWNFIAPNADYYCDQDIGAGQGWKSTGQSSQADCSVGFGKATCVQDPSRNGWQYMKNCTIWNDIFANGNKYCNDDYGSGWTFTGKADQGGCTAGFGKGLCVFTPSKAGQQYQKNCGAWASIAAAGDSWCVNDFGPGWHYVGRDQGGCTIGFGKGLCAPP